MSNMSAVCGLLLVAGCAFDRIPNSPPAPGVPDPAGSLPLKRGYPEWAWAPYRAKDKVNVTGATYGTGSLSTPDKIGKLVNEK